MQGQRLTKGGTSLGIPAAFGVGSVAILLLASLVPIAAPVATHAVSLGRPSVAASTGAASQALEAASNTLAQGLGPAHGLTLSCAGGGGSLACSARTPAILSPSVPVGWTRVTTDVAASRQSSGGAYDVKDGYTVLFGGTDFTTNFGDTWTYAGGYWTNITAGTHPAGRADVGMVYDAADKYVLLFGGLNGSSSYSDTWKFTAGTWTQLHPATHPSARAYVPMAYDAADGEVVLFGGLSLALHPFSDTWTFKAGAWTNITLQLSRAPPAVGVAGFATDGASAGAVLFGGYNGSASLGGTWVFHNKTWTIVHPARIPPPRIGPAMSYDTTAGSVVMFGGENTSLAVGLSDTWTFAGGNWTRVVSAFHPSSRAGAATSDGATGSGLLVFGGLALGGASGDQNDTWIFKGGIWKKAFPPVPIDRDAAVMTYDEADGYVVLFGGGDANGNALHDTWTFTAGHWKQLHPKANPSGRLDPGFAYDQADGYVLLFGGDNGTVPFGDSWSFLAGAWTLISSSGGPSARYGMSMTYDAADGYVLLFGGGNGSVIFGDTWAYSGGSWSMEITSGPSVRLGAAMTYDSEDGYVLLFGGEDVGRHAFYSDTWTYSGGVWTNLSGVLFTAPSPRLGSGIADNTYDGFVVMFGGYNGAVWLGDTWVFGNGAWSNVTASSATAPSARESIAQMAFDVTDTAILLFGGQRPTFTPAGQTWEFD